MVAQSEKDYTANLNQFFNGKREVEIYGGRIDILTDKYAIEVERASKWKNAIGQSLWYSQHEKTQPGIILIMESAADYKYLCIFRSVCPPQFGFI
jgi:hypothetical protein